MEAKLTGRGFAIEEHMPGQQWVTSQQTRWTWKVTPTGHGPETLHLTLYAYIDIAGRDAPLVVRTLEREIQVNITIAQRASGFIQKNWQWLWAAILVPIAGYLWKRARKAHRRPKQDKEKLDAGAKKIRAEQKAKRDVSDRKAKPADKPKRRSPLP
jgi:hypothetical protein